MRRDRAACFEDQIRKSAHARRRSSRWFLGDGGAGGGFQALHFLQSKRTKFPRRNIERERTIFHALDFFHVMADRLKHAPNLAIAALNQRDFVPGIGGFFHHSH